MATCSIFCQPYARQFNFCTFVFTCNSASVYSVWRRRQKPSILRARRTWWRVCFGSLSLYLSQIMNTSSSWLFIYLTRSVLQKKIFAYKGLKIGRLKTYVSNRSLKLRLSLTVCENIVLIYFDFTLFFLAGEEKKELCCWFDNPSVPISTEIKATKQIYYTTVAKAVLS